jgi:hypothetical protein
LVLLEPNPFYPLAHGRVDSLAEAVELRNCVKTFGMCSEWTTAAERFTDYWGGAGTWREVTLEHRTGIRECAQSQLFRMKRRDE